jgi:hypothetical protein
MAMPRPIVSPVAQRRATRKHSFLLALLSERLGWRAKKLDASCRITSVRSPHNRSTMSNERDSLLPARGSTRRVSDGRWKDRFVIALTAFFALAAAGLFIFDRSKSLRSDTDAKPTDDGHEHKIRSGYNGVSAKYIATQFISFTISTMGGLADAGECDGLIVDEATGSCYLGDDKNITADLEHRLQIVAKVIHTLHADAFKEQPSIDHADHVLKIVMFPEFFTRGPDGGESRLGW